MMKLFAFRDKINNENKEFGRYHALDLYSIIASTTESEWDYALSLRDRYKKQEYVMEAGDLVQEYFSKYDRLGIVRMQESLYYRREFQLDEFMSAIQELFPVTAETSEDVSEY